MNKLKYFIRDFLTYFFSSRLLLFVLLQLVIMHFYLNNMILFAKEVNYPISIWVFPFLFQNVYVQFLYGISVVYFFSTVPFFQHNQLYTVIRQGRKRWIAGKCLRIVFSSVLLVFIDYLISVIILLPHIEIANNWGKVLHSLSMTNAIAEYGIKIPIPYTLISDYTVGEAITKILIILFLTTMLIGMIMFVLSVIWSKLVAVILGTTIAVLTVVVANLYQQINQITYFSPLSWTNLLMIDGTICAIHPDFGQIVFVSILLCIVCAYILHRKIKFIDFEWTREE